MKKVFEAPKLDLIWLAKEDIITASGVGCQIISMPGEDETTESYS